MSMGAVASKVLTGVAAQVGKLSDPELEAVAAGEAVIRIVPKDLAAAVDMVLRLTDEQRKQLAAKEASIKFVPPGSAVSSIAAKQPAQPKPPAPSADEVRHCLDGVFSEDEARSYLEGLKLTAAAVKSLAKQLQIPLPAKATGPQAFDDIIKIVVRSRLTADVIRNS
jgi:hypothetical protein